MKDYVFKNVLVFLTVSLFHYTLKCFVGAAEVQDQMFAKEDVVKGTILKIGTSNRIGCVNLCLGKQQCGAVRHNKLSRDCQLITLTSEPKTDSNWSVYTMVQGCHLEIGSSCYHFVTDGMNWEDANQNCLSMGGTLAAITSAEESSAIKNWLTNMDRNGNHVWIGLNDITVEGRWEWASGEAFVFEEMSKVSEPNGGTGENCVIIYSDLRGWADYNCGGLYQSICEIQ